MKFEGQDIPENRLPNPVGWRLLIGKAKVEEKSAGGILLAEQTIKELGYVGAVALVLKTGDGCYQHPKFQGGVDLSVRHPRPWAEPGDIVIVGQYAGQAIRLKDEQGEHTLKLVNDDEILAIVRDPSIHA